MFLLRSAFWLTLAYLAIGPKDVDLGAEAASLSRTAVAAGQQLIVGEIVKANCPAMLCAAPKPSSERIPLPRPRPERTI